MQMSVEGRETKTESPVDERETKTESPFSHEEVGQITRHLYVGSLQAARDKAFLRARNITHILTAASRLTPYPDDTNQPIGGIKYLQLESLADHPTVDILQDVPRSLHFIAEGVTNGNVLVHCAQGTLCCSGVVLFFKVTGGV